ncbi:hypothetical protein P8452_22202 [Trifolium repens]|nr:hypothetical protein P8452_22202 [Trifolium repens]
MKVFPIPVKIENSTKELSIIFKPSSLSLTQTKFIFSPPTAAFRCRYRPPRTSSRKTSMKFMLLSLNRTTFVARSMHARWIAVYSAAIKPFRTTRVKSFHDLDMPWVIRDSKRSSKVVGGRRGIAYVLCGGFRIGATSASVAIGFCVWPGCFPGLEGLLGIEAGYSGMFL